MYLGKADPTDAELAAMIRDAVGAPASGVPQAHAAPAPSGIGGTGWLLIVGAAGLGVWALSKRR